MRGSLYGGVFEFEIVEQRPGLAVVQVKGTAATRPSAMKPEVTVGREYRRLNAKEEFRLQPSRLQY
jgi:hypothetical protein